MRKTLTRLATLALVPAAAAAMALAGASPASALYDSSSLTCSYLSGNSLNPPVTPTYDTELWFAYDVGNGWAPYVHEYVSGINTWKMVNGVWYRTDWAGGSFAIFDDHVKAAWVYTTLYYQGRAYPQGWKYLGSC